MDRVPAFRLWDIVIGVLEPPVSRARGAQESSNRAHVFLFEDTEPVLQMIIKGSSPHMRHVSRTHRVNLDWLLERITLNANISVKYVHTTF